MRLAELLSGVALAALLLPQPASAINALFLAKGPLGYLKKDDITLARAEIRSALETGADGYTFTWNNPKTNASGTVTPTKTFTLKGMRCRTTEFTANAGGRSGSSTMNLCKTKDGWKIVN